MNHDGYPCPVVELKTRVLQIDSFGLRLQACIVRAIGPSSVYTGVHQSNAILFAIAIDLNEIREQVVTIFHSKEALFSDTLVLSKRTIIHLLQVARMILAQHILGTF